MGKNSNKNNRKNKGNKKFLIFVSLMFLSIFIFFSLIYKKPVEEPAKIRISSDILIKPHSPIKGSETAPVTIVEFLDPECEACSAMHPIMKRILSVYEGKVRLVIRYMPLHRNSMYAAAALEEARQLNKYDEAIDVLFESQPTWGSHQDPRPDLIPTFLEQLGISKESLKPEVVIPKYRERIEMDHNDGKLAGVKATPTFFVNGLRLDKIGYIPVKEAIEKELLEASGK